MGQTHDYNTQTLQYDHITYMPCTPDNNFFPSLTNIPKKCLIYFCSPNNPTGAVATEKQLKSLVSFAKKNKSIILYDAAYASYIKDTNLPKSIYEIDGAKEVAIEIGSFSKLAGFTGIRLGWSIVPKSLKFDDGNLVHNDWKRIHSTLFNGASKISQDGGIACLENQGFLELQKQINLYLENAQIIKKSIRKATC